MPRNIIIFLIAISLVACASGSSIVVGEVRKPIDPSQVKLYLEVPPNYEIIGIVNASSDSGWTQQGDTNYAVAELKEQAAKLGANGIILIGTGETSSSTVGTHSGGVVYAVSSTAQSVSGKAVYVTKE